MADREIKYTTKDAALAAIKQDSESFSFVSDELRKDKDVVLAAVSSDGSLLEFASDELRNDKEVVSAALAAPWKPFESPYCKNDSALKYASEQLRNDLKFMIPEITSNAYAYRYVSEDIHTARELVLGMIQLDSGGFFELVADDFCNDRELVLAAVNRNGCMLEYASAELRNDKDVVLAAVNKNGGALQYASEALRNDKEVVLAAVNNFCGDNFECVSDELRDDKDVVLAAVKIYNYSLKYASDKLRNDSDVLFAALDSQAEHYCDELWNYAGKEILNNRECILAAAQYSGEWLKYAADELRNDKDVMLEAVSSDGGLLEFASDELQNDKEVVSAALAAPWKPFESPYCINDSALKYASEQLRSDREFVFPEINSNFYALKYVSADILNDKELVLQLVHGSEGRALEFASDELRNDKEMVLAIVSIVGEALEYASENLRNDKDVVLAAMQSDRYGLALSYASSEMQNDKDVVVAAVNKDEGSIALQYASEALRNDKEIVLLAVQNCGGALEDVSDELRNDKEVVLAAVNNYGLALRYASDELRNDMEVVSAAVGHDDWGDVVFGDLSEEMQDDPDVGYAFDCRHGRLVQFWNLLKPSGDKAPEVKIMYYEMMPAEFFEKLIGLYCEASKSKFSNPNIFRGRSASISSSLEDLFADFIAQNNPNKCTYYIDQPMKFEGEENHKYPDIVIQNQDDVIEHLIDMKADIGLNRHGMLDLCLEWEKRIEAAKGSDTTFKNGESKKTITGKFSNNLKCHVVVVTQENSSEKLLEDYEQVKTQCKNVGLYILSSGKHPNEYGLNPKDLLKQIFIKTEDFDRLLSSIVAV